MLLAELAVVVALDVDVEGGLSLRGDLGQWSPVEGVPVEHAGVGCVQHSAGSLDPYQPLTPVLPARRHLTPRRKTLLP